MAKIVVAVCGSISAYKVQDLVRELFHAGHDVHPILTHSARHFVTPLTLEILAENKVHFDEFGPAIGVSPASQSAGAGKSNPVDSMPHIYLKNDLDLFVVAPATANVLGKFATGIADNLVTSTYLALQPETKVLLCPAMNPNMYNHPAVQRNLKTLSGWGCEVVEPGEGQVACGDEGTGKLAGIGDILKRIEAMLQSV